MRNVNSKKVSIDRSLENEVERLRASDALATSEVRQRDVEWRPGDVLGEGSFSTVYRGTFCGIDVAVKELKMKLSQVRAVLKFMRVPGESCLKFMRVILVRTTIMLGR